MKSFLKKLTALVLLSALLICPLASCSISKNHPGAPTGMRPLNDGSNGIFVYISSSWTVDNSTGTPTAYFSNTTKTMVNLVTVPASTLGNKTIAEYFDEYQSTFESTFKDYELIPYSSERTDKPIRDASDTFDIYEYQYSFNVTKNSTTVEKYKFSQAYFRTSATSDLYIITYGTSEDKFDTHYEDVEELYANIKIATEIIEVETDIPSAEFTEEIEAPDGFEVMTGEHLDYLLFVPNDWTPIVNTGISAAAKKDNPSVTCSVTGFNLVNNNYEIEKQDYDSLFEATETALKNAYGESNLSYADENQKYVSVDFAGVSATLKDANGNDVANETAPRKYVYKLKISNTEYQYEQYFVIHEIYVYILTFCCAADEYAESAPIFDSIASNFTFKN